MWTEKNNDIYNFLRKRSSYSNNLKSEKVKSSDANDHVIVCSYEISPHLDVFQKPCGNSCVYVYNSLLLKQFWK